MSILNQSAATHPQGQPANIPPKGINSTESFQHISMAPLPNRSLSVKSSQLGMMKLITPRVSSSHKEMFHINTDLLIENQKANDMLESTSLCSDNKNMDHIIRPIIKPSGDEHRNKQRAVNISAGFEPMTLSVVHSLADSEKIDLVNDAAIKSDLFCRNPSGTLDVVVSSAVKLECKQMDQISKKMQRVTGFRDVRLESIIDPSLIAGFVISYEKEGSHVIDLSVKGQLAELVAQIDCGDHNGTASALQYK